MVMNSQQNGVTGTEKILLAVLPYWDPLIPPMGISCIKSFLQQHHYVVRTVDANIETEFKELYDRYFKTLAGFIPPLRRSNFYNIGKDVLRNHMMACFNKDKGHGYDELVKIIVARTFYIDITTPQARKLERVVAEFYTRLEGYFRALLEDEKPTVLGLSVFRGNVPASLFAFQRTRQWFPHIKTVMGGGIFADQLAPGSPDLEFLLKQAPYIDKVIIGEGEHLFLEFLRGELSSKRVHGLEDIGGKVLDVSTAAPPDFSDLQLQYYPHLGAYTSRSCPFQCGFCSETVRWGRYRKKSAARVVAELTELHRRYNFQLFMMSDSLLNPIITELAQALSESQHSFYWDGYLRVDPQAGDPDTALTWRRGGFYRARLGVESGSQRVLDLMDKRITPQQIKEAIASIASVGIKTTAYWLVGFPGETEEDFQQTLDLVTELKDDIYEVDFNAFWYFVNGQVDSDKWREQGYILYPPGAREMLILETRDLHCLPSREERFSRMNRFAQHLHRLGIHNPYSLNDIHRADERWKKLHKNAVPSIIEFKENGGYIDEAKGAKRLISAKNTIRLEDDWGF